MNLEEKNLRKKRETSKGNKRWIFSLLPHKRLNNYRFVKILNIIAIFFAKKTP